MNANDPDGLARKLQNEIENFLAEVSGNKPPRKPQQQKRGRAARQRRQTAQPEQQNRQQRQQSAKRRRPPRRGKQVGSGVDKHVREHIGQHVAEHLDHDVDEHVQANIVENVNQHLGKRSVEMPEAMEKRERKKNIAAEKVAAMLRNKQGVRDAILVSEILNRPVIFKRK